MTAVLNKILKKRSGFLSRRSRIIQQGCKGRNKIPDRRYLRIRRF